MPSLFPRAAEFTVPGDRLELTPAGSWIFRLPRDLRTLNDTLGSHWSHQQNVRSRWELELTGAIAAFKALRDLDGWPAPAYRAFLALRGQRERRRVGVVRYVPSSRNFIRDDDNLAACGKHLQDAMKRVRLIHDDSRTWLERVPTEQCLSPDGCFYTVVTLDRPDVRKAWR